MLKIYNTLTRKKEEFVPLKRGEVKMYVCGITPYDECHIGHARCYVVFDVIRRYLEYKGHNVHYVQNFTDIDDKIINKAKEEGNGDRVKGLVKEIAEKYIQDYFKQMDLLNVKRADEYPRVTEHIPEIIEVIKTLIENGYAYVIADDPSVDTGKSVYFEVAKFNDYGKLSHRSPDQLMPGARVEVDERKKNPLDFALWKSAKEGEPCWESPWGKGRPGWHIECSVMSTKYLGETLDIHGGGQDLIFPHHENEIAQSEACTGKPFAKFWIHNAFVTINKEKMSKSLGNFFTIKEVLEKYDPMVIRLFLLSAHYRQPINYSDKELEMAKEEFGRMQIFKNNLNFIINLLNNPDKSGNYTEQKAIFVDLKQKFEEAMDDDFNTPKALGYIHELITQSNTVMNKIVPGKQSNGEIEFLKNANFLFSEFTDVLGFKIETKVTPDEFKSLIKKREEARKNKDWVTADRIRNELKEKDITIEDTSFGPRLVVKNK